MSELKNSLLFREINSKCLAGAGGVTGDGGSSKNVIVCARTSGYVCIGGPVRAVWTLNGLFRRAYVEPNGVLLWDEMHVWCTVYEHVWKKNEIHVGPKRGQKNCLAWIQNNVLFAPDLYWHDRACCNYHLRAFSLVFTEPLQWKAGAVPKNSWSHPAVGQHLCFPLIIG